MPPLSFKDLERRFCRQQSLVELMGVTDQTLGGLRNGENPLNYNTTCTFCNNRNLSSSCACDDETTLPSLTSLLRPSPTTGFT